MKNINYKVSDNVWAKVWNTNRYRVLDRVEAGPFNTFWDRTGGIVFDRAFNIYDPVQRAMRNGKY